MQPLDASDPVEIGRYRLAGHLGSGGMGRVYLGRSPGGRPAAVKVISDQFRHDTEALERFRREVDTLRTVHSAYTAALIDSETSTPPYWLATEYIPGPTLDATVDRDGPLPADLCRALLAALAEGLNDIHAQGVCHRDVKPQNVILSATGPQLIDFGIARGSDQAAVTQVGHAAGTPGYTAPETLTHNDVGPAADVFALGATIAFAATGRPPFGGGHSAAVAYRSVHQNIDLDGVDPVLAELITACVNRDPRQRPGPDAIIARCQPQGDLVDHPIYHHALTTAPRSDGRLPTPYVSDARGSGLPPTTAPTTQPEARTAILPVGTARPDDFSATTVLPVPGAGWGSSPDSPQHTASFDPAPERRSGRFHRLPLLLIGVAGAAVVVAALITFLNPGQSGRTEPKTVAGATGARPGSSPPDSAPVEESASPSPAAASLTEEAPDQNASEQNAPGGNAPDASAEAGPHVVSAPLILKDGESLQSTRARLIMQADGNLVVYDETGGARWSTGTFGASFHLRFQNDGNLVIYDKADAPVWASNTAGHPGAVLRVDPDGNVVIASGGDVFWQSGTAH